MRQIYTYSEPHPGGLINNIYMLSTTFQIARIREFKAFIKNRMAPCCRPCS